MDSSIVMFRFAKVPLFCSCARLYVSSVERRTALSPDGKKINLSKLYTVCLPVRGDNPRALASGLSPEQADKRGTTI